MFNADINRALIAAADLINTAEGLHSAKPSSEQLESVEELKTYLSERDPELGWPVSQTDRTQREKVLALRARLRETWEAAPIASPGQVETVNALLEGVGTRLAPVEGAASGESETAFLEAPIPVSKEVSDVMTAQIAAALCHLVVEGETGRLRICKGDECDAAIVDLTRNRSKLFCDYGNCANRAHVRAYRARQAALKNGKADDDGEAPATERKLTRPSSAEKAESINRPTSASAVAAKEFRDRMRSELMDKRGKKAKKAQPS